MRYSIGESSYPVLWTCSIVYSGGGHRPVFVGMTQHSTYTHYKTGVLTLLFFYLTCHKFKFWILKIKRCIPKASCVKGGSLNSEISLIPLVMDQARKNFIFYEKDHDQATIKAKKKKPRRVCPLSIGPSEAWQEAAGLEPSFVFSEANEVNQFSHFNFIVFRRKHRTRSVTCIQCLAVIITGSRALRYLKACWSVRFVETHLASEHVYIHILPTFPSLSVGSTML